jgi:hypothetical protein
MENMTVFLGKLLSSAVSDYYLRFHSILIIFKYIRILTLFSSVQDRILYGTENSIDCLKF